MDSDILDHRQETVLIHSGDRMTASVEHATALIMDQVVFDLPSSIAFKPTSKVYEFQAIGTCQMHSII